MRKHWNVLSNCCRTSEVRAIYTKICALLFMVTFSFSLTFSQKCFRQLGGGHAGQTDGRVQGGQGGAVRERVDESKGAGLEETEIHDRRPAGATKGQWRQFCVCLICLQIVPTVCTLLVFQNNWQKRKDEGPNMITSMKRK